MTDRLVHKMVFSRRLPGAGFKALLLILFALLFASTSYANARRDCFSPERGQRIEGCTKLLDGKLSPLTASLVYAMRALAYSLQGRYNEALDDYDKSLKINPDYPHALNNRAWAYYKIGKPSQGFADVERALRLSPRSAHTYDTRAHINQAMGNIEKAMADYRSAIKFGGSKIIKLYQCGLQANGLYSGSLSGISTGAFNAALETCVTDPKCDPLPAEEECRKLTS